MTRGERRRSGVVVVVAWFAFGLMAPGMSFGQSSADLGHDPPETVPANTDTVILVPVVHPSVAKLGERITVRVVLATPDTTTRLLGPPAPLEVGDLDIIASAPAPTEGDSTAWTMTVALFQTGELTLPPIPFRIERSGRPGVAILAPYTVSIEPTVAVDSTQAAAVRDIRGPVSPPVEIQWLRIVAAVVLVAALLSAFVFWRRRRASRVIPAPRLPSVPPDVEALNALAALEREALPARGQFKDHYTSLSMILRSFVERQWTLPAVESTTFEIERDLERRGLFQSEQSRGLVTLLEESDLVKFAKFAPTVTVADEALRSGRDWVEAVRVQGSAAPVSGVETESPSLPEREGI